MLVAESICRIAVLVSGGGTNLQALINSEKRGDNPDGKIVFVASANPNAYALERAKNADIETFVFRDEAELLSELKARKIDLIVLAGFLKVTGATVHFVNEVPDGGAIIAQKAVNVEHDDTAETLQKRVMEEAEWVILPEVVSGLSTFIRDRKE